MSQRGQSGIGFAIGTGVVALLLIFGVFLASAVLGYWLENVSSTQVALRMNEGRPFEVVGPGVYTDFRTFADIKRIEIKDIPFTVSDDEVLTHDKQRVGVTVSGTVRRPGKTPAQYPLLLENWASYSLFYTDDVALVGAPGVDCVSATDKAGTVTVTCKTPPKEGQVQGLGRQATKVCVGDLDFEKAVVGSARDVLKECIDKELNDLAAGYGLSVTNIVVPNVGLSVAVQKAMDDITNQRFAQQVAEAGERTAKAQADQQLAVAAGAIRVEQGKVQEQAKQDALTADLNQKTLSAQRAVIEQQKANDLYSAQQDLAIQAAKSAAASEAAKSTNAATASLAAIYQQNPVYADYQNKQAIAQGWKQTDKVYIGPGVDPVVVIGGGTQPVVQTPAR